MRLSHTLFEKVRKGLSVLVLVLAMILIANSAGCTPAVERATDIISSSTTHKGTQNWRVTSLEEAIRISGLDIYSPSYIPERFVCSDTILITYSGFRNSWRVYRYWYYSDNSSIKFDLSEYNKLPGTDETTQIEINRLPVQRIVLQEFPDVPATLFYSWEKDGIFFSLSCELAMPMDEDQLQKIAASIEAGY